MEALTVVRAPCRRAVQDLAYYLNGVCQAWKGRNVFLASMSDWLIIMYDGNHLGSMGVTMVRGGGDDSDTK